MEKKRAIQIGNAFTIYVRSIWTKRFKFPFKNWVSVAAAAQLQILLDSLTLFLNHWCKHMQFDTFRLLTLDNISKYSIPNVWLWKRMNFSKLYNCWQEQWTLNAHLESFTNRTSDTMDFESGTCDWLSMLVKSLELLFHNTFSFHLSCGSRFKC